MEILNPTPPPPGLAGNHFAGFATPADFPARLDRENRTLTSQLPEITEDDGDRVYVAVGKSMERSIGLLRWTFKRFGHGEIGIIHVHQPSPLIPTLLGKLPASQANNESLSAYRREEREQTRKLLLNYLNVCGRAKVKANIITDEAGQVNIGIVDLVEKHGIKKLVMGAVTESCMKVKKNSSKANYAARNAPAFCQIWFVNKGKHVWTREASEDLSPFETLHSGRLRSKSLRCHEDELKFDLQSSSTPGPFGGVTNWIQKEPEKIEGALQASLLRSKSLQCHENVPKFDLQSRSSTRSFGGVANRIQTGPDKIEGALQASLMSSTKKSNLHHFQNQVCSKSTSSASGYTSSAEKKESSDSDSNLDVESLYNQLTEARIEAEESKDEAFAELLKRKNLETEAVEAFDKVIAFEAAIAHEVKLRKEVEDLIRTTKHEQEKLLEQREEVTRKLHKTMRNVAVLDSHAREARSRQEEAAGELRLIQASIANLRHERKKIRKQKAEAVRWLERWKNREHAGGPTCNGFVSDSPECEEFSLLDLQTATCNFSECFKIGQGGFGCVYKGEIFDRSVAIKKLHPHNIQGRSEFQQEVQVLSKLQHPHLVTLLGACLEAWCLVYEYLPNGGLQDHLFPKINTIPLTWKTRTRIAAQISSAILFLHSSKPEKIIHGDLKPENIMLDSEFNCKIGDFGICRLVPEETVYSPKFHQNSEPKGAFPYSDPEFHKTGWLTPKSDIYAFGIIILQLLTGKPPLGLAAEVRRAVSCGKLASILDASAGEWPTFVARRLVDLGLKCCELNSRDRPDLTLSVVQELERLHITEEQSIPSFFLCPILQEIMHDPQVAADGFTYEGEALRGWLENGRDTSPMTNLKLSHLHLTPNHALRHAIDEWLCKS